MPTFKTWDRSTFTPGDPIELHKPDVVELADCHMRVAQGPVGRKTFRAMSKVKLANGEQVYVDLPAGELRDRLNDEYASQPEPTIFDGIEEAASPEEGETA